MKKLITIILCSIIAFSPLLTLGDFSYADGDDYPSIGGGGGGEWHPISTEEDLVAAFKAYCKRNNFDISHVPNTVKAIISWDYEMLEGYASMANVDITLLNAHIWKMVTEDGYFKLYYDTSGLDALSRIYGAVLQENELDYNDSKSAYTGKVFTDALNNNIYCFVINSSGGGLGQLTESNLISLGLNYIYKGYDLYTNYNGVSVTFPLSDSQSYTNTLERSTIPGQTGLNTVKFTGENQYKFMYADGGSYTYDLGYPSIAYFTYSRDYYLITYCSYYYRGTNEKRYGSIVKINTPTAQDSQITYNQGEEPEPIPEDKAMEVTTSDTTINNYITNNDSHDTYNYDDDDDPPTQKPDPLPPTDNFPTGVTDPDGNPFNFTMPNIGIDWNLQLDPTNLPFPFSIPHDIIRFLTILDSEPEAPHYEIHTEILNTSVNLDIDLSVFDDGMVIIRNLILAGYCVFLIISTRALFHIY